MRTKTQLEKEIEELEKEYSESADRNQVSREIVAIRLNQAKTTLTQTNAIIELIEEERQKEVKCMDRDEHNEQELEHINQIEMCEKILTKIKGDGV